jgi:hypothetical protein
MPILYWMKGNALQAIVELPSRWARFTDFFSRYLHRRKKSDGHPMLIRKSDVTAIDYIPELEYQLNAEKQRKQMEEQQKARDAAIAAQKEAAEKRRKEAEDLEALKKGKKGVNLEIPGKDKAGDN